MTASLGLNIDAYDLFLRIIAVWSGTLLHGRREHPGAVDVMPHESNVPFAAFLRHNGRDADSQTRQRWENHSPGAADPATVSVILPFLPMLRARRLVVF